IVMAHPLSRDHAADVHKVKPVQPERTLADLEEDPEEEEPEEEDIDIDGNNEMDGPKLIHPDEVVEDALMPLDVEPDTSSDPKLEVEAATVGTIRHVPLTRCMPFGNIHVRIGSSSTAPAGHNPEDLVSSSIRSNLDALYGIV
nr:hypothetical protein [Tanacetum cinerariifolium]